MSAQSEIQHLCRLLKAPTAAQAAAELAERARGEEWSYERYLEAVLSVEASAREASGGESRIRQAGFPARKGLEEFDFTFQSQLKRSVVECQRPSGFPHRRPSSLPSRGHLNSPLMAIGSPRVLG